MSCRDVRPQPRSGGMATSSITWVRNVALARSSMMRNREADWGMIRSNAARR